MNNMTAKEISSLLAQRVEAFAKYTFPNGKKVGNEFCVASLQGETGESLKICLSGDKAGVWCDFATGDRGDLLDLMAQKQNLTISEAILQAKQWLGISSIRFEPYRPKKFNRPALKFDDKLSLTSAVKKYLLEERKLTEQTLQIFKIGEQGHDIIFPYYRDGELLQVKYLALDRPNGKKKIHCEANCEPCLFGWQAIPDQAREIAICEGEIDAMTLYQYGIPALSVPFGGGRKQLQWLEYEFENLAIFDKIYLSLDNDITGQEAVAELIERIGRHRCYVVQLPHKDANACLQAGVTADQVKSYFENAKSLDPAELKSASIFVKQVIDEFYSPPDFDVGVQPPWEKAKGKILFRPDELSIWTGWNGGGKSQFLGQIVLHSMKQGAKVCIASLELKPQRLLMRLTRQAAALRMPTSEYIQAIHDWYEGRLWLFDLVGNAKSERLLEVFKYARQRYGINTFVIDSFMKLDIAEDDYKAQKTFLEKLCDFKNEHNCHIHLVVHPRKGMDETRYPGKLDAKGTGAITDLADNCFTVWRNKAKQDAVNKIIMQGQKPDDELLSQPDCLWICDKQRNGEWEGKIGFWFDPQSFQYLNHLTQKPVQYVNYSNQVGR